MGYFSLKFYRFFVDAPPEPVLAGQLTRKNRPEGAGAPMKRNRLLVMGLDRDAAYAVRNLFEFERHDIDVCIDLDVVRESLVERNYNLLLIDSRICLDEDFDLVDFQLDRGLRVPLVIIGGENTGLRRSLRSRQGLEVIHVDLDGEQLLEMVNNWNPESDPKAAV
ncbi:MAG: hypothetical protein AAEJ04_04190 [Planctomycetota bacterium]